MDIYFDESIHVRGNFIVLAAVAASPDQIATATDALRQCGFEPGRDEFKSSVSMKGNLQAQELRERFRSIIGHGGCKVALGVCAIEERDQLHLLARQICDAIPEDGEGRRIVYLDQGMKLQAMDTPGRYEWKPNCDSKKVIGIQLADCCAHFMSTMLLGELGLFDKMVPARPEKTGYDFDLELAWELWASLRYALAGSEPVSPADEDGFYEPLFKPYGFVLSDGCDDKVAEAARKRFGAVWVGCIH
jgi:Protein of unknown function (DUF3800)